MLAKDSRFPQPVHGTSGIPLDDIAGQTERILGSPAFQKSKRLSRFLSYAVQHTLAGDEVALKETVLGVEVFDRGTEFDPRIDPIVRIDARRLRARLTEYYLSSGAADPVVIEFEPGSYVPQFRMADEPAAAGTASGPIHAPKPIRKVLALDMLRRARRELEDVPSVEGAFKALKLFQRAAEANPEHALSQIGVALASIWMPMLGCESAHSAMTRARRAAQRALELEPALAEAHVALGIVYALYDFDVYTANSTFLLAGRLNPKLAYVQQFRATAYLAPLGQLEEAGEIVEAALRREPLARFRFNLGWLRYLQGDYDTAIRELKATLEAAPDFVPARFVLIFAYERAGCFDLARQALDAKGLSDAYPLLAHRGAALRHLREGRREDAVSVARHMEAAYTAGSTDPLVIAEVFAALGNADSAFEWLDRGYEDRRSWLLYLNSDPAFESLRGDPRFAGLLTRLGLRAKT